MVKINIRITNKNYMDDLYLGKSSVCDLVLLIDFGLNVVDPERDVLMIFTHGLLICGVGISVFV